MKCPIWQLVDNRLMSEAVLVSGCPTINKSMKGAKRNLDTFICISSSIFIVVKRMREEMPPVPINVLPEDTEAEGCVQEGPECQQRRQRATPYLSSIPVPLTRRGRGRDSGAEREHGDTTPHAPEEPGAGWNGPEVTDTAQ